MRYTQGMSKAFLPEDSAAEPEIVLPPRPAEPQPITPRGRERLRAERAGLDPGDVANRARIAQLDAILRTIEERAPALERGGAGFGCEVIVEDARGARRTYEIVGPDEVDAPAGRISAASPLGRALLGRRAGDDVEVERGGRVDELRVVAVRVP